MRFEYQSPSVLQKATLTLKAPHRWRSSVRPWVFDKKSGVRFQLAKDKETALQPLTRRSRTAPHMFQCCGLRSCRHAISSGVGAIVLNGRG